MDASNANAVVAEDLEVPGLKFFSDGSFSRYDPPGISAPPSPEASLAEDKGVASKDITLDNDLGLWVRIYCPLDAAAKHQSLPVCVYFHGGGFCIGSASWKPYHALCIRIATAAGAMVVSVNYRLAPEHRLPAAYDDCASALSWLRSGGTEDPWLSRHSDLSRIFLVGDSAGGYVVHHVGLREPSCCRGLVMVQPSFAGEERTASEAEAPQATNYSDKFREMSLPVGATRDHPLCNPLATDALRESLERATLPPLLVVIGGRDIRRDRERDYCEVLKKYGKDVKVLVLEEEDHAFYVLTPETENTELLVQEIALFVKANS
ncbi:hypothetical protein SUGI_0327750 [Cryptomeria japonica]|uniref:probable carboxylesterase 15 n=1 Tax=Cryptomeria japonica TaxID=3369 RepID=UPI002408A559|nr:probable carboxylesterase 15 [Cryptomeria japonica]GLJ18484.1 hypothetical protein SUGI_0327750 [Cryptomeria japonica]